MINNHQSFIIYDKNVRSFHTQLGLDQWFPTCGPRAKNGLQGFKKWPSTS